MPYKLKKSKIYVRTGSSWDTELVELNKAKLNKKTFATKLPVQRDAIGRIILFDKEGKIIGRKPKDIVEIGGKTYYDDN